MAKKIQQPSRKSRMNSARPVVIIICDGTKTEPIYFKNFDKRDRPLDVKVVSSGKNYFDLIKKGIHEKKGVESKCTVWCVSDVDADPNTPNYEASKNDQLKKYAKRAKEEGFQIAISNPCFELWYLLHFDCYTGLMPTFKSVEKKLNGAAHLPGYDKTKDYFTALSDKLDDAINNANKLKQYHEGLGVSDFMCVSTNPYTDVWQLVESIR